MNIYVNEIVSSYGGGLALVAANSPEEASEVLSKSDNLSIQAAIWEGAYTSSNWKQLPNTTAEVKEPCLLIENNYIE